MFLNGGWLSERITAYLFVSISWMNILVAGGVLYGSNIIKDLDCANFFGEKFGSVEDLIILYP